MREPGRQPWTGTSPSPPQPVFSLTTSPRSRRGLCSAAARRLFGNNARSTRLPARELSLRGCLFLAGSPWPYEISTLSVAGCALLVNQHVLLRASLTVRPSKNRFKVKKLLAQASIDVLLGTILLGTTTRLGSDGGEGSQHYHQRLTARIDANPALFPAWLRVRAVVYCMISNPTKFSVQFISQRA